MTRRVFVDGVHHFTGVAELERARGDDEVGSRERAERLAQRAGRKQVPVAPRSARARHHDLQILLERPVLEPVVEDDRGHAESLDRHARGVVAVGPHHDGNARQPTREQKGLVAGLLGIEADRGGVGDDLNAACAAPIPPADDRRAMTERRQRLDGHLHRGRLSRAADGQVADRDDAARQRARFQDAAPVEPFASAEETPIAATGDREHARRCRAEALFPSADEALPRIHARAPG